MLVREAAASLGRGCSKVVGGLGGNFAVGIWRMSIEPIALMPALGELSPGSAVRAPVGWVRPLEAYVAQ